MTPGYQNSKYRPGRVANVDDPNASSIQGFLMGPYTLKPPSFGSVCLTFGEMLKKRFQICHCVVIIYTCRIHDAIFQSSQEGTIGSREQYNNRTMSVYYREGRDYLSYIGSRLFRNLIYL